MKIFTGRVIATKNIKTATVAVDRFVTHPVYKKRLKRTEKYQVHDELGVAVRDQVEFVACAPVSKMKRWKITKILNAKSSLKASTKIIEVKSEVPVKKAKAQPIEKKAKSVAKKTAKAKKTK